MFLLGVGDLHFDGGVGKYIPRLEEFISSEVRKCLRYAKKHGVEHVVFYGDICDTPRMSYESTLSMSELLFDPRYKDLQFHVLLGNHDFQEDRKHSLELLQFFAKERGNIHIITDPVEKMIDGVPVRFMPWPVFDTSKNALNIGHLEVDGSLGDSGRKMDSEYTTSHVTLMGHLHTRHRVRNTYYSGTLYQTNFGEKLPKGFHHVSFNSPKDYEVQWVKNSPEYTLHAIALETRADIDKIPTNPKQIVKLLIHDGLDVDPAELDSYPNVVKTNAFRSKKELEALINEEWDLGVEQTLNVDFDEVLHNWMIQRDVDPQMQKRVKSLHKEIITRGVSV